MVECIEQGVCVRHMSKYRDSDYFVVSPRVSREQRDLAVAFVRTQLGQRYGLVGFVSLGLALATDSEFFAGVGAQPFCSQQVSRATEKYVVAYRRDSPLMSPADIAYSWGVQSGEPQPPQGLVSRALAAPVAAVLLLRRIPRWLRHRRQTPAQPLRAA